MAEAVTWYMKNDVSNDWLIQPSSSCELSVSWDLHPETVAQLHAVHQLFLERGLTPRVGLEMETTLQEMTVDEQRSESVRRSLLTLLAKRTDDGINLGNFQFISCQGH